MRILDAITEYINKRRDAKIINCLRDHEVLTLTELQLRTDIRVNTLQTRLQILAEKKLVTRQGTDQRSYLAHSSPIGLGNVTGCVPHELATELPISCFVRQH